MSSNDQLLQEVAQIVHANYRNGGRGLEKTCKEILDKVTNFTGTSDVMSSKNVFAINSTNISLFNFQRDDMLLVGEAGHLYHYLTTTLLNPYAPVVITLKECRWKTSTAMFAHEPTIEELLARGATVHLLRS